jgi:type I restriction enzyme M protein
MFSNTTRSKKETNYVRDKIFAIDFDRRSVRVGRMLNIIAGDGHTNVLRLNTLDYTRWDEVLKDSAWLEVNNEGFRRLEKLQSNSGSNKYFNFDIVMANPPFAGDITDEQILANYKEIAPQKSGKSKKAVGRDILFIERNLNFLKPGGRMAIVLPQGRFNNSSDKYIRDFIAERCRILAVIGLHGNTFKPHTGTKTSVLFVQKWDDKLCPRKDDYNIFFATQQLLGKDNSGEKLYWKPDLSGSTANLKDALRDKHGHPIVWHDLYSAEDNRTPPGIAEAFIEFAKKEELSFF